MSNETSVKLPEINNQVLMIADKDSMVQLFNALVIEINETITLKKLASADAHYDTIAGRNEWENIRNKKAGYLPYRRACLALGKLIALKDHSLSG